MAADPDKTEDATPSKLDEAREKGDVPKSKEFGNFFVFFGCAVSFYFASDRLLAQIIAVFKKFFDFRSVKAETVEDYISLVNSVIADILWILTPLCASVFVFGVAGYMSQFGLLFTTDKITPSFEKLNPWSGFTKMFSMETFAEFVKATTKIVVVSALMYLVVKGEVGHLMEIGAQPVGKIFIYLAEMLAKIIFVMLIFMAILGLSDFFYQKWNYAEKMKMSMKEIKDEMKNKEGDPLIKSRIRQMQRERSRARMMEKVPKADVVVTNPTHVAVALQYKKGLMRAPVVVAKGAGFIAIKIKELAAESGVPILERKQLARFLYRNIEIDEPVPESLYTAVAEVLAYVYKMKKKFSEWRGSHATA